MHADGKSTLASVSKWNSRKVNCLPYLFDSNLQYNLMQYNKAGDMPSMAGVDRYVHSDGPIFVYKIH